MLETSTIARIDQIASDRISGATELALRASEALSLTPAEELLEAAMAVVRAQPAMASVYNAAQAGDRGPAGGIRGPNPALGRQLNSAICLRQLHGLGLQASSMIPSVLELLREHEFARCYGGKDNAE